MSDARKRYRARRLQQWVQGRALNEDTLKQNREAALQEARQEPGFNMAVFNAEYPPVPGSDDDDDVAMEVKYIPHLKYSNIRLTIKNLHIKQTLLTFLTEREQSCGSRRNSNAGGSVEG